MAKRNAIIKPVPNHRCPIFSTAKPLQLKGPVSQTATDISVITWYIQPQIDTQPVLQGSHRLYMSQCLYRAFFWRILSSVVSYCFCTLYMHFESTRIIKTGFMRQLLIIVNVEIRCRRSPALGYHLQSKRIHGYSAVQSQGACR